MRVRAGCCLAFAALVATGSVSSAARPLPGRPTEPSSTAPNLVPIPLFFEERPGALLVRRARYTASVDAAGATFSAGEDTLRMSFRGVRADAQVAGVAPTGAVTRRFREGRAPVDARHFARAEAPLGPGISVRWRADARQRLAYDLVVAPEADPAGAVFDLRGARRVRLDAEGALRVQTAHGAWTHTAPLAYQETGSGRVPVEASFTLREDGGVGFAVEAYDRSRPLVIDPTIEYVTRLGPVQTRVRALAVDAAGAAYVAGSVREGGAALPDAWVAKVAPDGASVAWSVLLEGDGIDRAFGIAVSGGGEAVIVGETSSEDFPLVNSLHPAAPSTNTGFVAGISADGGALRFATFVAPASTYALLSAVALDRQGRPVAAGRVHGDGALLATEGAYRSPTTGGGDAVVWRLAADGSAIEWAAVIGGAGDDRATSLALDAAGNVYVAGASELAGIPVTADLFPGESDGPGGRDEPFLAKLSADGSALAYAVEFATTSEDEINAVAVDGSGAAYVTGSSSAYSPGLRKRSTMPVTHRPAGSPAVSARSSPFVMKVNPSGDALEWAVRVGGPHGVGYGIAADAGGGVVVSGIVARAGPPPALQRHGPGGAFDAFLTRVGPGARSITYTAVLGGDGHDLAGGFVLAPDGRAFLAGDAAGGSPFERLVPGGAPGASAYVARFAPQDVKVVMRSGGASDGPDVSRLGDDSRDSMLVAGGHGFANVQSPFDPRTKDVVVTLRAGATVRRATIQANDLAWRAGPGGLFTWTGTLAGNRWQIALGRKSFRVVLTRADFSAPLANPFAVDIAIGSDRGMDQRNWRKTAAKPRARYRL